MAALIAQHQVASIVVPDSVRELLGYYRNNTVNSRALIETAVAGGVRRFIFFSTAAVYGNPGRVPVREEDPTVPTSPYGSFKLMTERQAMILRWPCGRAGPAPRCRPGSGARSAPRRASGRSKPPSRPSPAATTRLTVSLPTAPPNSAASARRTRRVYHPSDATVAHLQNTFP